MRYEIYAKFDDQNASLHEIRAYFEIMEKYDIFSVGHEKTGTCTMWTHSINIKTLLEVLKDPKAKDIKVLSVQPTSELQQQLN